MYVGVLQPELGVAPEVSNSKVKNFLPLSLKNFSHKFQLQKKKCTYSRLTGKQRPSGFLLPLCPSEITT